MMNAGKYARSAVAIVYDQIGGHDAFAQWAEENKGDFYTKMFTKIIGREVEIGASDSVEALLDKLDNGDLAVLEAEFTEVDVQPSSVCLSSDTAQDPPGLSLGQGVSRSSLARMAILYAAVEDDDE